MIKAAIYFAGALAVASVLHAETKDAGKDTGVEKEIRRLIGELGAPKYAMREAAQKQLLQLGGKTYEAVLALSVRTYATTKDPEVKSRLRFVMASLVGSKIFDQPRGYLGIQIAQRTGADGPDGFVGGVAVLNAFEDGVAAKAGIQAGDIFLKIDDLDLVEKPSTLEFINHVQSKRPGDKVKLAVRRGESVTTNEIALGELSKDIQADLYGDDARKEFFKKWLDEQLKALRPKDGQ